MKSKSLLLIISLLFLVTNIFAFGISGDWKGESICTIKDSPCHDEVVVYHVTEPDSGNKLQIRADKIINNVPEEMGTFDCLYKSSENSIVCEMKYGTWRFNITGNKMQGSLHLPDGRLYRRISVTQVSAKK